MRKVDQSVPGYRFQDRAVKPAPKSDKAAWHLFGKPEKICGVCQKPYERTIRSGVRNGVAWCAHDLPSSGRMTVEERGIQKKLGPGELAARGSDGVIRIFDKA